MFDDGATALVAALPACTSLQQLDLSSNTVCDDAAVALCGALEGGAAQALTHISLADNRCVPWCVGFWSLYISTSA